MLLAQMVAVLRGMFTNERPDGSDLSKSIPFDGWTIVLCQHSSDVLLRFLNILTTQGYFRSRSAFLMLQLFQLMHYGIFISLLHFLLAASTQPHQRLSKGVQGHNPTAQGTTKFCQLPIIVGE